MSDRELLEKMLAAQVLTLARVLKSAKESSVSSSTSDHVAEAIVLIAKEQSRIIAGLRSSGTTP